MEQFQTLACLPTACFWTYSYFTYCVSSIRRVGFCTRHIYKNFHSINLPLVSNFQIRSIIIRELFLASLPMKPAFAPRCLVSMACVALRYLEQLSACLSNPQTLTLLATNLCILHWKEKKDELCVIHRKPGNCHKQQQHSRLESDPR